MCSFLARAQGGNAIDLGRAVVIRAFDGDGAYRDIAPGLCLGWLI